MIDKRTYASWAAMWQRCTNPNRKDYHLYGGRGIWIYPDWYRYDYFLEDMGKRPKNKTLDRKDSNGPYTTNNCRWATASQQMKGRRKGVNVGERNTQAKLTWAQVKQIRKCKGRSKSVRQKLADKFKVSFGCIDKILRNQTWSGG